MLGPSLLVLLIGGACLANLTPHDTSVKKLMQKLMQKAHCIDAAIPGSRLAIAVGRNWNSQGQNPDLSCALTTCGRIPGASMQQPAILLFDLASFTPAPHSPSLPKTQPQAMGGQTTGLSASLHQSYGVIRVRYVRAP